MTEPPRAEVGVFGGSGFYDWFPSGAETLSLTTPYGSPSGQITIGLVNGRRVAFMPRHGKGHRVPAQAINYRANLWAMHEIGVRRVLAPCAVGSLQPEIAPGDLVICDQFVDRTTGRADTFYPGPDVVHVSTADPFCPELRAVAEHVAKPAWWRPVRATGTVVVVQGPRFSTRAESQWFGRMGWDVIGMTTYPEAVLARELEMCYLTLALVTDYDAAAQAAPGAAPVDAQAVLKVLANNVRHLRDLLALLIVQIPATSSCSCQQALAQARV